MIIMKLKAIICSVVLMIASVLAAAPVTYAADDVVTASYVEGDVNDNGAFEIADVVLLQKWLLGNGTELANWKAADLCEDEKLDVFDLCLMRRLLVERVINPRYEATFIRAKDGDTYVVTLNGEDKTVRLIGVDTPESVAPATYSKENTEEGKEVSDIVKEKFTKGETVYLEFDVSETDKYGRLLAYVYFKDGTMVQDWLLSNGYARMMTVPPNVKYADHFHEIENEAARNKVGLWNGFFDQTA